MAVAVNVEGAIKPEDVKNYVKTYSLYEKVPTADLIDKSPGSAERWGLTYAYLKLAEKGKAEFPRVFIPNGEPYYAMLDWTSFNDKIWQQIYRIVR